MTWHSFLDLSTMQHRHLVASYAVTLGLQFGYFGWVLRGWLKTRRPSHPAPRT
jgi:hypothetical protein